MPCFQRSGCVAFVFLVFVTRRNALCQEWERDDFWESPWALFFEKTLPPPSWILLQFHLEFWCRSGAPFIISIRDTSDGASRYSKHTIIVHSALRNKESLCMKPKGTAQYTESSWCKTADTLYNICTNNNACFLKYAHRQMYKHETEKACTN